jgi:maltooligosyltrehalose trehalohydrolase
LSSIVDFESLKLAAGVVLLSPFLPLLFMGEEYGETAPFQYFTSHTDPALAEAVRRGRSEEFAAFSRQGEVPDPQDVRTFLRSKLTREDSLTQSQRLLQEFYRELLRIRKQTPALAHLAMDQCRASPLDEHTLLVERWCEASEVLLIFHFSDRSRRLKVPYPEGQWARLIHSADPVWNGTGDLPVDLMAAGEEFQITLSPRSFFVYERGRKHRSVLDHTVVSGS